MPAKWFLPFDKFRDVCRTQLDIGGADLTDAVIDEFTSYLAQLGAVLVSDPVASTGGQRWVVLNITNFVNAMHKGVCVCVFVYVCAWHISPHAS